MNSSERRDVEVNANVPIGPGAEFDIVRRMVAVWGNRAHGIGDDAAVCELAHGERLVISSDSSIDRVHFRREWMTFRQIGRRATIAALSDLAAMGARPTGVLIALSLPPVDRPHVDDIARGIGDAVDECNTVVLGGDVSAATEFALTVTVVGASAAPIPRRGARPGDSVYVTGVLGGPGCALAALRAGSSPEEWCLERFIHPQARVREGMWLAAHAVSSMIDISDGLGSELAHLAAASGVRLVIDGARIPCREGHAPREALVSGEEYELLLTAAPDLDCAAFEAAFRLPLTKIGVVAQADRGEVELTLDGRRVDLAPGHDHFSS